MKNSNEWTSIAMYLSNDLSEEERQKFDQRLEHSQELNECFNDSKKIWENCALIGKKKALPPTSAEVLESKIAAMSARLEAPIKNHEVSAPTKVAKERQLVTPRSFRQLAAIITLAIVASALAYVVAFMLPGNQSGNMVHHITGHGEVAQVNLPDGSTLWLNAQSKASFLESFTDAERRVVLSGEGFFDVLPNESAPFVVETSGGEVKVIGTSFGVKAYPEEVLEKLMVTSGKVSYSGKDKNLKTSEVSANEMLVVDKENKASAISDFNANEVATWKNNVLSFRAAKMEEVVKTLERWYGVEIVIANDVLKDRLLTYPRIENKTLAETLSVIIQAIEDDTPIVMEEKNGKIYLK